MKRRNFLYTAGLSFLGLNNSAFSANKIIMTVNGAIPQDTLGVTLTHEHVLVDFIGAEKASPDRYDQNEAYKVILPHLLQIVGLGCKSFVECTPAYIGRDVKLLKRLSEATGLHILSNTGYYGAAGDKFIPKHAYDESADQLAERWLNEWKNGIDGTGIQPGFIKTGVDSGPLSDIDAKLVRAAAKTSKQTGLTIASHTGDTIGGMQQLDIVMKEGANPSWFIWVHAQNDWKLAERITAAKMGAWISVDNVNPKNLSSTLEKIITLKAAGVLNKLLLSHDAGWYSPGEPNGGKYNGYDTIFTILVPSLKNAGFTQQEINQILINNPANAFTIG